LHYITLDKLNPVKRQADITEERQAGVGTIWLSLSKHDVTCLITLSSQQQHASKKILQKSGRKKGGNNLN